MPHEGHRKMLACSRMEKFNHLTGKKISMATKAGRDTSLSGGAGLDPLIRSHGMVQMQVFVLISAVSPNHTIN